MKEKSPVHLRSRRLKNGARSLYLDIYYKGVRRYEYLHLYLKEGRTPEERRYNDETLAVARAVLARKILELQRSEAALPISSSMAVRVAVSRFVEERRSKSAGTYEVWSGWENQIREFKGMDTSLKNLTKEWWGAYKKWVSARGMKSSTEHHYLSRMRCVLNRAERDGLLLLNPAKGDRLKRIEKPERVWLTADELRKLKGVSDGSTIERAFLFGCLTGLRYSDIRSLKWEDVQGGRIVKRIVKTHKTEYLDLNAQAVELMGERGKGVVFPDLDRRTFTPNKLLRRWADRAGLSKHISFHTSRHTFAVLMLSAGVDIYTVSRLLGHSSITTTQVYADIVDAKKKEAVNLLPQI